MGRRLILPDGKAGQYAALSPPFNSVRPLSRTHAVDISVDVHPEITNMIRMDKEQQQITDYIFLPPDPQSCDIGFVFGTRLAGPVERAHEAYALGLVPRLVLSGGKNRHTGVVEADRMASELTGRGVPADCLLLENRSSNTLENVLLSREVIENRLGLENVRSMLVIAKHYHVRRAMMTLKRHFPAGTVLRPFPYDALGFTCSDWHEHEIGTELVMSEWGKIPKYLAKGDLAEL